MRNNCVFVEDPIPYSFQDYHTHKTVNNQTKPGWYVRDNEKVKFGSLAKGLEWGIGSYLETVDGSIIKVSKPSYTSKYNGPIGADFWVHSGRNHSSRYKVFYDCNLNHIPGNHLERDPGLDIVSVYTGDTRLPCPHCGKLMDEDW